MSILLTQEWIAVGILTIWQYSSSETTHYALSTTLHYLEIYY